MYPPMTSLSNKYSGNSFLIELKLSLYRRLSQVSEKKSNANIIDKNIKTFIRSCLESIQNSNIIIILIFVSLGYIYELVVVLLILSFISFIDSLRSVIKIKNQLKLIKYTNLSSFKEWTWFWYKTMTNTLKILNTNLSNLQSIKYAVENLGYNTTSVSNIESFHSEDIVII